MSQQPTRDLKTVNKFTPPITHEQSVALADYIFIQPQEDQRQTLIDCLDIIDWEALVTTYKSNGSI